MIDDDDSSTPSTPSRNRRTRGDGSSSSLEVDRLSSVTVVQRVAEATACSPLKLPPLNETVDADSLDSLFVGRTDRDREGPTVVFSYTEYAVRLDSSGRVTLRDEGTDPADDGQWPHVSPVETDEYERYDVATQVVLALAERSGHDPVRVRSTIEEFLDLEALSSLNRSRVNGVSRSGATVRFSALGYDVLVSPDETVAVGSTLQRLTQRGGNVLVVGAVPDVLVDAISTKLLGVREHGRRHLFALLDRDVDTVADRVPVTGVSPTAGTIHVLNHATTSRSSATARTSVDDPLSVTEVTGDTAAFGRAVVDALSEFVPDDETGDPASGPTDLRVCVDSLRPVLEERDTAGAKAFLEPICASVREVSGLAHFVLPVDRTTPVAGDIEALFDATVELRVDGTEPQQRWSLHESDYTTPWFSLEE